MVEPPPLGTWGCQGAFEYTCSVVSTCARPSILGRRVWKSYRKWLMPKPQLQPFLLTVGLPGTSGDCRFPGPQGLGQEVLLNPHRHVPGSVLHLSSLGRTLLPAHGAGCLALLTSPCGRMSGPGPGTCRQPYAARTLGPSEMCSLLRASLPGSRAV